MQIGLINKKITTWILMASFLLMPFSPILTMSANAQDYYDFSDTVVYDYSDIYDLSQPPELPVSTQVVEVNNVSQNVEYDFSDEAQRAFDAQQKVQSQQASTNIYPQEKQKNKRNKQKSSASVASQQQQQNEPVVDVFQPLTPAQQQDIDVLSNNNNNILKGGVVFIPEGSSFQAVLQSSISSASLSRNDTIAAILQDDWYSNGVLIAPAGSIVYGKAVDASKAGFAYGNGSLSITFTEVLTPKGDQLLLTSNVVTVQVESQRTKKIATRVASGSILGAVTGVLWALIAGGDVVDALAIGAGVGAVGGTVRAVASKGEEVEVEAGTCINVRLIKPMNAQPYVQDEYYTE